MTARSTNALRAGQIGRPADRGMMPCRPPRRSRTQPLWNAAGISPPPSTKMCPRGDDAVLLSRSFSSAWIEQEGTGWAGNRDAFIACRPTIARTRPVLDA